MVRIPKKYWSLQRCWRQVQSFKFRACKDEVVDSSVRLKYLSTPALSSPDIHAFISNFFFFLQKMALDKIGFKGIAAISRNAFSDQTLLPNSQLPLSNIETHFKDLSVLYKGGQYVPCLIFLFLAVHIPTITSSVV